MGVVVLAYTAFWVWTLVDAATTPDEAWREIGQSKLVWIVVMALVGAASIVYVCWPRPQLRTTTPRAHSRSASSSMRNGEPSRSGSQAPVGSNPRPM